MATYYIAKTGNDSNDGSSGSPWLTIEKARNTIVAGDTVIVSAGTYVEDTGSGYLIFGAKSYASETTIQAATGETVIVKGASGVYSLRYNTVTNLTWDGIEFESSSATMTAVFFSASNIAGCKFNNCTFRDADGIGNSDFIVSASSGGNNSTGVEFNNCTIESTAVSNRARGIRLAGLNAPLVDQCTIDVYDLGVNPQADCVSPSITSNTITLDLEQGIVTEPLTTTGTITVTGNTITANATASGWAILIKGGTTGQLQTVNVNSNTVTSTGNAGIGLNEFISGGTANSNTVTAPNMCLAIAIDGGGASGTLTSFNADGNTLVCTESVSGHTALIGKHSDTVTFTNNTCDGRSGAYGLVVKGGASGASRHTLTGNTIYGGTLTCIYLKGCEGLLTGGANTLYQTVSGGACIQVLNGDTTPTTNNITLNDLRATVTAGQLFNIGAVTTHIGTSFAIDNNRYTVCSPATWGSVIGTTVDSLSATQTAWDGYAISTNEESSTIYKSQPLSEGQLSGLIGRPLRGRM